MKKILMTLAAVAMAATMNAQTWIGGEIGFESNHVNGASSTTKEFRIAPEIGYNVSDNFSIAAQLGYVYTSSQELPVLGTVSNTNGYTFKPYARYTFVKAGNFSAFFDGGLRYTFGHIQGIENNVNNAGVFITPGLAYAVSPKVTLVSHLGDGLTYNHTWMKDVYRSNAVKFHLFNGISFGAYYNF
jgi:hypothetical protein